MVGSSTELARLHNKCIWPLLLHSACPHQTRLIGLNKLRFIVPYETRKTITIGIFNSVLVYCLPLFGGDVRDLQVLQNKAGQIVAHKPPFTNRAELFDQLGWMTVYQLIVYHTSLGIQD